MHLETPRLWIRDWQPAQDAAQAIAIYGDPAVTQWLGSQTVDGAIADTQARLERYVARTQDGLGCWAVIERTRQTAIGTLLLIPLPDRQGNPSSKVEIGWHFRQSSWGQGFATEAAQAVMAYGFETLKLLEIYAVTLPSNHRSIRVMLRLGMTNLGISHDYYGGRELLLFQRRALHPAPAGNGVRRNDPSAQPSGR